MRWPASTTRFENRVSLSLSLSRRPSVTKSIGSFYGNLMAVAVGNALSMKFSGLFSRLGERYRF